MEQLKLRKGAHQDVPVLMSMLHAAIATMEAAGIHQWDEIYPDEATIRGDIARQELHIGECGGKAAVLFVLNREADPAYASGRWLYADTPYLVLHRLCVSPAFQNRGIGAQAVRQAEYISQKAGAGAIRLDAFSQNPFALRLYEKLGYRRVGQAPLRMGLFYLYEKKLGRG